MLFLKICFILSSFLLLFVEVKRWIFCFYRNEFIVSLIFQGSLFGGLFGGQATKKGDTSVGSSEDRQKEIDAIRKEINSNNAPPPVSFFVSTFLYCL